MARSIRTLACVGLCTAGAMSLPAAAAPEPIEPTARVTTVSTTAVTYRGPGQAMTVLTPGRPTAPRVDRGVGCPPTTDSVAANFNGLDVGSEITIQLGMRQSEGFGVVYSAPATSFPLEINQIEQIFATVAGVSGTDNTISCGYTIEVYDGVPGETGTLVFTISSDPDPGSTGLPADMTLQRVPVCSTTTGAQASVGRLQFSVDPQSDPADRIFVNNVSGTNQFTVFVRITRMNQPNPTPCALIGGEEPPCSNIFLTTEANNTGALNFSSRNMLFAIDCGSPFFAPPGFTRFSGLGLFRPSRDVLQQVTFTPVQCAPPATGACCNASTGACSVTSQAQCVGTYQGDNSACSPNPCPQPTGACCLPSGACEIRAANLCTGSGFIFRGGGSVCASANCPQPTGACCNGTACAAGITQANCTTLGGNFLGAGSTCGAGGTCPLGACCLPIGSCLANLSAAQCQAQSGTFQGVGTSCSSVNCPQPAGACCTAAGGCASVDQATCVLFGGVFQGPLTTCTPSPCGPALGVCCRGSTCAAGVASTACTGANSAFLSGNTAACTSSTISPCCKADYNKSAGITVQDIFDFLAGWFAGSPNADMTNNGAGTPTTQSIFDFLSAWFAGGC